MQILVHCIQKNSDDFKEINEYIKMSSKWADIKDINKFNSQIAKAQSLSKQNAHVAYNNVYMPCVDGFCIGLDEKGDELDSPQFADLLKDNQKISFFIGGAYGLSSEFKSKMNRLVSLSRLTLAHKIAKLMLFEQIFRGLCINANHPYHK